ncbi:peptidoglycan-associated lipoprotein Pal [Opitutaceae bacterium]
MNFLSKKLSLALVSTVLALTGCTKKPVRPDPSSTVLGPGSGGGLNPSSVDAGLLGLTDPSASGLMARGDGVIEDANTIRGLLQPVYFEFDQAGIRASERAKLQAAQDYLSKNPQHRILLEGHCDWRGTAEYNLGLGDRRAAAARQYLETIGVLSARLETLSKGDLDAIENATDEQMSRDRRVEIVILKN